ncbi:protein kinase family protein [Roseimaritima sediminicola]|uniref:hypothetical protein n=1 Tax=Roseimaritima sediminicola TaxID=2662066 RepID=UPI00129846AB|nr:hypothetical protein [Roseimaritima sediminicola]
MQETPDEILERVCADILRLPASQALPPFAHYLRAFPVLRQDPEALLDVIDAHVCVVRGRNESVDASQYTALVPELASQIQRLLDIDAIESNFSPADDSVAAAFSVDEPRPEASAPKSGRDPAEPLDWTRYLSVDLPEDIRPGGLLSLRQDVSCLRGLADDQTPVLIKVVNKRRLCDTAGSLVGDGDTPGSDHASRIGDRLETLSRWQHPAWIRPLALVESDTQIVMVRPWIAGTLWTDRFVDSQVVDSQGRPDLQGSQGGPPASGRPAALLRSMADVGFAVAALHQQGLAHGTLHPRNLLRDHDGGLRIVDAGFGFPDPATQWDWHFPPAVDPANLQAEGRRPADADQERGRLLREQTRDVAALLRLASQCLLRVRLAAGAAVGDQPCAEAAAVFSRWCQRQHEQCLSVLGSANRTAWPAEPVPRQPPIGAADIADQLLALSDGRPLRLTAEPRSAATSLRARLRRWLPRRWATHRGTSR